VAGRSLRPVGRAPSRRWKIGWFKAPDEQGIGGSLQLLPILIDGQPHQFALLQEGVVQVARVEWPVTS
jgi:hypothetical protein